MGIGALLALAAWPQRAPAQSRGSAARSGTRAECTVERVIDGDTFACVGGERVRLLLIDAPERSQGAAGGAATRALREFLPRGERASLEFDVQRRDRYDRLLAYVWVTETTLVNEELLRRGVALVSVYPPNVKYVERFRRASEAARRARAGLWATDAFACAPRDHRAGRC